jgi:hypothetical protein
MAKRVRRERIQESIQTSAPVVQAVAPPVVNGKIDDFAQEYYYVYTDMRNVIILSAGLFALMLGLGFFI